MSYKKITKKEVKNTYTTFIKNTYTSSKTKLVSKIYLHI